MDKKIFFSDFDRNFMDYIERRTQSSLAGQMDFYNENIDVIPKEIIISIRGLAEVAVEYLYLYLSKGNENPGPYWCLIWKGKNYERFENACKKAEQKNRPFPRNPQQMWTANQLLQSRVSQDYIRKANTIRNFGNKAAHNKYSSNDMNLTSEAKRCLDALEYMLQETNQLLVKTQIDTGKQSGIESVKKQFKKESSSHEARKSGCYIQKWFSSINHKLAFERTKTQADYDKE